MSFPFQFALVGDGFFAVDRGGEQLEYTRSGAFNISVQGQKGYLVTTDGGYVLDSKGKPIALDKLENSNLYNLEGLSEKLGVFTFPNPYGLSPRNGSSFVQSDISGAPKAANVAQGQEAPYKLVQYALESSKVELSQEMTQVILTQRAFQMNARIVQTADQIEEIVNNLR